MAKRNPDRIDFVVTEAGTFVTKLWTVDGRDVAPDGAEVKAEFDLDNAVDWLQRHGYTVRRWPTGARAWKGQPWPIRTRSQIRRRRAEVERLAMSGYYGSDSCVIGLDFALDI